MPPSLSAAAAELPSRPLGRARGLAAGHPDRAARSTPHLPPAPAARVSPHCAGVRAPPAPATPAGPLRARVSTRVCSAAGQPWGRAALGQCTVLLPALPGCSACLPAHAVVPALLRCLRCLRCPRCLRCLLFALPAASPVLDPPHLTPAGPWRTICTRQRQSSFVSGGGSAERLPSAPPARWPHCWRGRSATCSSPSSCCWGGWRAWWPAAAAAAAAARCSTPPPGSSLCGCCAACGRCRARAGRPWPRQAASVGSSCCGCCKQHCHAPCLLHGWPDTSSYSGCTYWERERVSTGCLRCAAGVGGKRGGSAAAAAVRDGLAGQLVQHRWVGDWVRLLAPWACTAARPPFEMVQ